MNQTLRNTKYEIYPYGHRRNTPVRRNFNEGGKHAFTLIEIVVVLAIVSIVLGMSFPFFARFAKGSKLKNAATNISTVLRTARSYAITKRKNYLVIINDKATPDLYYAVKIYQNDDGTVDRWHKLPQGIIIESTTFNSTEIVPFPHDSDAEDTKTVVKFKPTGGTTASGSIYIKDNEDNYKRIKVINVTGRVKVTNESP